ENIQNKLQNWKKVDYSLLGGHVFLNGIKVTKKSRQVIDGDIIDRISENQPRKEEIKFGQVQVVNIGDLTKKGNFHIEILRKKSLSLPVQEFWKSHK
ncbi:hypothetical protein, partial [Salmonella sp. s54412]|uniref:hypothetical protein n=1 Tax=Salmonella sp. s54412 TaxID=3160128 RepID=UPI0037547A8C